MTCVCRINNARMTRIPGVSRPVLVVTPGTLVSHAEHDVAGDVGRMLPPGEVTKTRDLKDLVFMRPDGSPVRSFCITCDKYRHNAHVCDLVISPTSKAWVGDALQSLIVRCVLKPGSIGVDQERYTSGEAQRNYLLRFYPKLVPPPPAGVPACSNTFEVLYWNCPRFRWSYNRWLLMEERQLSSIWAALVSSWFMVFGPYLMK